MTFKKSAAGFIPIIFLIIGLLVFLSLWFIKKPKEASLTEQNTVSENEKGETSKDPFENLTIPYLAGRKYESELGGLRQIADNNLYTSYLTNYDSDGYSVNGLLTKPKGEEPAGGWPAIVFVHGYIVPSLYNTLEKYTDYVDYLAKNGFVVFKIDLRGHGTSEGSANGAYYSGDYIVDVLNARAALSSTSFVNPKKIGLWGHSMAGNVVFRSMAASDIPAAVIWAGAVYTYSDFSDYSISDNSYRPPAAESERRKKREELALLHGAFDPSDAFWKLVPATNFLGNIKGAIQINHAINDSVVSIDYSRNLKRILDKTSIIHELQEYEGGGHNIEGASFTKAMENTVAFFKKYL